MDENMDNLFANMKKMIDNGNIPPEVQQMINNLQNNSQNSSNNSPNNSNIDINNILSQVSPEMINNLSSMLNTNNSSKSSTTNSNSKSQNNLNIDMNTILKMKSLMENMNNNNDPRANLLYSLKPYLRDSKKNKVDQYVNMLNITKLAEFMNKPNDDKKN